MILMNMDGGGDVKDEEREYHTNKEDGGGEI